MASSVAILLLKIKYNEQMNRLMYWSFRDSLLNVAQNIVSGFDRSLKIPGHVEVHLVLTL